LRLSPSTYELQKASVKAYEEGKKDHVFHGHCWVPAHPKSGAVYNLQKADIKAYEEENRSKECLGHCRAGQVAVQDSIAKAAYEMEKASIKSYEDGWDDWDGPIWPWKPEDLSAAAEDRYDNGYTPPELQG